jgi:hypothetical protein
MERVTKNNLLVHYPTGVLKSSKTHIIKSPQMTQSNMYKIFLEKQKYIILFVIKQFKVLILVLKKQNLVTHF